MTFESSAVQESLFLGDQSKPSGFLHQECQYRMKQQQRIYFFQAARRSTDTTFIQYPTHTVNPTGFLLNL